MQGFAKASTVQLVKFETKSKPQVMLRGQCLFLKGIGTTYTVLTPETCVGERELNARWRRRASP